jgi:hypothetical protein
MAKIVLVSLNPAKDLLDVERGIFNGKQTQFLNAISRRRLVTGFANQYSFNELLREVKKCL